MDARQIAIATSGIACYKGVVLSVNDSMITARFADIYSASSFRQAYGTEDVRLELPAQISAMRIMGKVTDFISSVVVQIDWNIEYLDTLDRLFG